MANAIDKAMYGSEQAPLSKEQRRLLVARYVVPAYQRRLADGLTGEPMEDWRHEEQFKACGKTLLRECVQKDWLPLTAHFLRIRGRIHEADTALSRTLSGQLAVARQKLREACMYASDVIEHPAQYVRSIAAARYKTPNMLDLTERQIWVLVFDLRRNAQHRRKRAKTALAAHKPDGGHG